MALMLVGLPACVSQGTYDQTLKDLQSTKSHLDRLRVQNEALNKQVIGLKESNAKHKEELDKTNAQIASLKEEVSKERRLQALGEGPGPAGQGIGEVQEGLDAGARGPETAV